MLTFFRLLASACNAVAHLLAIILKIVYNILRFFRVRLLALYLASCGIAQLCFRVFSGTFGSAYFWAGFGACCLVTLFCWISSVRARRRRKKAKRDLSAERAEESAPEEDRPPEKKKTRPRFRKEKNEGNAPPEPPVRTVKYPQYYEVEGHADYMFAEYEDRYELFRREASGWSYVRTDYKDGGEQW